MSVGAKLPGPLKKRQNKSSILIAGREALARHHHPYEHDERRTNLILFYLSGRRPGEIRLRQSAGPARDGFTLVGRASVTKKAEWPGFGPRRRK